MEKILVIDDNDIIVSMLVQLLTEEGYEAEGAHNGRHGLMLLETKTFDLIVTDIIMPDKEGLGTILDIRKKNKTIPIIAISGGGKIHSEQYLTLAQNFGANYAMKKPLDTEQFIGAVRECLFKS